jgi:UDP:flavonoid glycosyltransferase YjiC (YdhE family)
MRVLFISATTPSHFFPTVPLAWACRLAGHEVRVAGQPDVVEEIKRAGLTAVPVGHAFNPRDEVMAAQRASVPDILTTVALPEEERRRQTEARLLPLVKAAQAVADDLIPLARQWRPDLVVADPSVFAAPLVAGAVGARFVRHLWGPDMTRWRQHLRPGETGGQDREHVPDLLRELYERNGLAPRADFAACTVDPCPASVQVPGVPNRLPIRCVPYNGVGQAGPWLFESAARPRVCVSWGTLITQMYGPQAYLVPQVLTALAGLGVETVVMAYGDDREALGQVPDGVRVVDDTPMNAILPACAAIVHHGGAGTMLTAAYYGVPQVIIAGFMDQPFNAARLAATGAGFHLTAADVDAADIKTAASAAVFDEGPRDAARRLRAEILAQPAPAQVVRSLEELA